VGCPAPRIKLFLRRALLVDPSPQGAEAPPWAPQMAIVWPLRPAHGTAVAPRDAYECARAPSRRTVARRRGFAATAAPETAAAQKGKQNTNSAKNPHTNRLKGGVPPGRSARVARAIIAAGGMDDTTMEPQDAPL
jgi:hypothetical protein